MEKSVKKDTLILHISPQKLTVSESIKNQYFYVAIAIPWIPEALLAQIGTFISKQTAKRVSIFTTRQIQSRKQRAVLLAPRVQLQHFIPRICSFITIIKKTLRSKRIIS